MSSYDLKKLNHAYSYVKSIQQAFSIGGSSIINIDELSKKALTILQEFINKQEKLEKVRDLLNKFKDICSDEDISIEHAEIDLYANKIVNIFIGEK